MDRKDRISASALKGFPRFYRNWQETLDNAIEAHCAALEQKSAQVRKDAPESAITLIGSDELGSICVKEFRWRGLWRGIRGLFRGTKGEACFRNSRDLLEYRVPCAEALALRQILKNGLVIREYLFMESRHGFMELDRFLSQRVYSGDFKAEKDAILSSFARFMARIHSKGIFHSDLKTCNIMFNGDPLNAIYLLIDYDDVLFFRNLPMQKRVKNLSQIFLSTPIAFGAKERMLWLRLYGKEAGIPGEEIKNLARMVLERVKGRKILYVSHNGDQEEDWET